MRLLAAARDTNPKRQQGLQLIRSLTLRVSAEGLTPDRAEYKYDRNELSETMG
jgi:hypothetical protein